MSRKYKFGDSDKMYFTTFAVVYWIDVFTRDEYRNVLIESWKYCQDRKGLEIFSWVIMTNHVHLIVSSNKDPLEDIFRDMKRHTSSKLKKLIVSNQFESRHLWISKLMIGAGTHLSHNRGWQFWQQVAMPIEIRNQRSFYEISDYIHKNPVKAGFVEKEEDWRYSSARDFSGKKGLIELSYIE